MRPHSPAVPLAALAAAVALSLTACSDDSPASSAASGSSAPRPVGTSAPATDISDGEDAVVVTQTVTAVAPEPEAAAEQVVEDPGEIPVLGYINLTYVEGFGTVQPDHVTNGGMCASTTISDITWDSWGGETATGTGTECVSAGVIDRGEDYPHPEPLTASDLGDCGGVYAYRALRIGDGTPFSICTP